MVWCGVVWCGVIDDNLPHCAALHSAHSTAAMGGVRQEKYKTVSNCLEQGTVLCGKSSKRLVNTLVSLGFCLHFLEIDMSTLISRNTFLFDDPYSVIVCVQSLIHYLCDKDIGIRATPMKSLLS